MPRPGTRGLLWRSIRALGDPQGPKDRARRLPGRAWPLLSGRWFTRTEQKSNWSDFDDGTALITARGLAPWDPDAGRLFRSIALLPPVTIPRPTNYFKKIVSTILNAPRCLPNPPLINSYYYLPIIATANNYYLVIAKLGGSFINQNLNFSAQGYTLTLLLILPNCFRSVFYLHSVLEMQEFEYSYLTKYYGL